MPRQQSFKNAEDIAAFAAGAAESMALGGYDAPANESLRAWLRDNDMELTDTAFRAVAIVIDQRRGSLWGPLEPLINDPDTTDITVNGPNDIWVLRRDGWNRADNITFGAPAELTRTIERLMQAGNRGAGLSFSNPIVDFRIPDGPRLCVIIPPASGSGPVLAIRKYRSFYLSLEEMASRDGMSREMALFLDVCVRAGRNIIVAGGTGSGKTTLLSALLGRVPAWERMIFIEDTAEITLPAEAQRNVVRLLADRDNERRTPEELLRASLRMSPNRIIVGECRGGEVLTMLQAMNTGHEGSMSSIHANTTADAINRLEALALMAAKDMPLAAVRGQIASAIHLIVQTRHDPGREVGMSDTRRITEISEVIRLADRHVEVKPIFAFESRSEEFHVIARPTFWGDVSGFWPEQLEDPFAGLPDTDEDLG